MASPLSSGVYQFDSLFLPCCFNFDSVIHVMILHWTFFCFNFWLLLYYGFITFNLYSFYKTCLNNRTCYSYSCSLRKFVIDQLGYSPACTYCRFSMDRRLVVHSTHFRYWLSISLDHLFNISFKVIWNHSYPLVYSWKN